MHAFVAGLPQTSQTCSAAAECGGGSADADDDEEAGGGAAVGGAADDELVLEGGGADVAAEVREGTDADEGEEDAGADAAGEGGGGEVDNDTMTGTSLRSTGRSLRWAVFLPSFSSWLDAWGIESVDEQQQQGLVQPPHRPCSQSQRRRRSAKAKREDS